MEITTRQLESIKELCNIGVGKGAAVLNTMLSSHISLKVPFVEIISSLDFKNVLRDFTLGSISAVELGFDGEITGVAQLLFPTETASSLVAVLAGDGEQLDMDALRAGTFCEVGNIVLNGVMGSISNMLNFDFDYSVPEYLETNSENFMKNRAIKKDSHVLLARTRFCIDELDIEGDIALFMEISAIHTLVASIEGRL